MNSAATGTGFGRQRYDKIWQGMMFDDVAISCNFNAVMNSMLLVASCCLLQGLCEFSSFMNKFYFGSVQNPNVPTHECVLKWRIIAKARTRVAHFRWIWTSISSGMQNSLGLWKLLKLTPVVCFLIVSERHIDRARAAVCSYTSSCIYDYTDTIQYMDQALPPPLPPNGMGPIYCPRIKSSPPPWCGGDVVLAPSPCGVVGVWYDLLGMYGVYGRFGMACLESMVCMVGMVCVAWMVGIVWMVGMVCKSVGYGMFDMTLCMVCMVCMVTMMGMECFLCKVGMVCMACMFGIVCMVGVVVMFHMYGMCGMYDRYDRYGMYGIIGMYGR